MGLQRFLEERKHLVVVGEAADGLEALSKVGQLSPDVVLLDLVLPELDGLAVTEILRREKPEVKVLVLMAQSQPELWLRIARCGAHGFISKEASADELVQAIEIIANGGRYSGL
jgi:DNA-binding NarL/FixJ family response regulator